MKILNQEAKYIVTLEFNTADEFRKFSKSLKGFMNGNGQQTRQRKVRRDAGVSQPKGLPWTEREINFLKENYISMSLRELTEKLPGRTTGAIYTYAKIVLGLDKKGKNPTTARQKEEEKPETVPQFTEKTFFPKFDLKP